MENLKNLNEDLFQLYGRIYNNKKFLSKKQYNYMINCLFKQYSIEYNKFFLEKKIEDKKKVFELKIKSDYLIPWKFLFFKNIFAKKLIACIKKECEDYIENNSK